MSYLSIAEAAVTLHMPVYTLRDMCECGMIAGAVRFGRIWTIPENICSENILQSNNEYHKWIS